MLMKRISRFILILSLFFIPINVAAKTEESFQKTILKNGLTLMYRVMKDEPTVSITAVIPIGMNYAEQKSIAHLTEHMVFRGSKDYTFSDILNVTNRQGGTFSGFTTFYVTTYNYVVPRDNFENAFNVFNSMLWSAAMTEDDFAMEQKIVLHEADMNYTSRLPGYSLLEYFYPEYSDTRESVHGISIRDLRDFYQSYYQPVNATYIIAGDFQPEAVITALEGVENVWGPSSKSISDATVKEFQLPQGEIVEDKNLYPYHYQVLLGYQFNDLSPSERIVLWILGYLYGSTHRIDYHRNEYQEYYVVNRSIGDGNYFGMYYLERNHPYTEESYRRIKMNLLNLIRQFKKVDLKQARNNLVELVELEREQCYLSSVGAVEYELQRLIDPDNLTVDSLEVLKKLTQRDLERVIDKCFTEPPVLSVLIKHKASEEF